MPSFPAVLLVKGFQKTSWCLRPESLWHCGNPKANPNANANPRDSELRGNGCWDFHLQRIVPQTDSQNRGSCGSSGKTCSWTSFHEVDGQHVSWPPIRKFSCVTMKPSSSADQGVIKASLLVFLLQRLSRLRLWLSPRNQTQSSDSLLNCRLNPAVYVK